VGSRPYGISASEVLLRRLSLPALLDGRLPTVAQAQATKALVGKGASEAEVAAVIFGDWGSGP
jgi:hypothetical protein